MIPILLITLGGVVAMMVLLWIASVRLADASIVDIFWGPGFAVVAWSALAISSQVSDRAWLVTMLVTVWGLRLALHIATRNRGKGEDSRYRAMRAHHGPRFWLVSLGTVFLLQGALMWIVSLPLQAVHTSTATAPLGWLDACGVALVMTGLLLETIADLQLTRFLRSDRKAGAVMDRGLWRYSRHPNYFGDCLVWWGFGVIGLAAGGWWALIGPIVMNVLLVRVSGVALLESTIAARRPGYAAYVARTNAFVPWPPRGVG